MVGLVRPETRVPPSLSLLFRTMLLTFSQASAQRLMAKTMDALAVASIHVSLALYHTLVTSGEFMTSVYPPLGKLQKDVKARGVIFQISSVEFVDQAFILLSKTEI